MIYRIYKDKRHQIVSEGDLPIHGKGFQYVEADEDGWIPWHGGECPLPDGHPVDVRYRCGEKRYDVPANKLAPFGMDASVSFWKKDGSPYDIIAYSPILDAKPELAWDGSGLPPEGCECLVKGTPTGSICPAVIDYIDGKHCIWHWKGESGETMHARVNTMEFRPIRSEEDEAVEEMREITERDSGAPTFYHALYRAGYRRQ